LWLKGERGERGWDDSWNRLFTKEPADARASDTSRRKGMNELWKPSRRNLA